MKPKKRRVFKADKIRNFVLQIMGNQNAAFEPLRKHAYKMNGKRSAIVLGPTGATGRYVLAELLRSNEWNDVKIIHRRNINFDEMKTYTGYEFNDIQKGKLKECVINMEMIGDEKYTDEFKGYECVFCCLGTTRDAAGSAEGFRKVDLYMVRDSAQNAKKAGVKQYNLLTSKGANPNIWANDWGISHPLFYAKVKGLAENEVIKCKFDKTSIFRPGFLERPGSARLMEKFVTGLPVADLAKCMVFDAENNDVNDGGLFKLYYHKTILSTINLAKSVYNNDNGNETKEEPIIGGNDVNNVNDDAKVEEPQGNGVKINNDNAGNESNNIGMNDGNDVNVNDAVNDEPTKPE